MQTPFSVGKLVNAHLFLLRNLRAVLACLPGWEERDERDEWDTEMRAPSIASS